MKKKNLERNVVLGIMACGIFFQMTPGSASAMNTSRSVVEEMAGMSSSTKENALSSSDPNAFTTRIQRILNDYYRDKQHLFVHHASPPKIEPAKQQKGDVAKTSAASAPLSEGRYNFDWQKTPIAQSLYAVAKRAHKDIVVNGSLDGNVYMSLHNVTCEQAMQRLSDAFNFNWMIDDTAIIVSTSQLMMQSKVFPVHHAFDLDKLSKELQSLGIDEKNIYANTEQRTVSVTATPYQLREVDRRLASVDKPISQCLVVAQLIEIQHGRDNNLGFQYSLPTYSHSASSSTSDASSSSLKGPWLDKLTFSGSMSASRALSKGKVIARPMIMMLNGQEGMVNFGEQVPVMGTTSTSTSTEVSVEYKDVGTKLTITPSINTDDGEITLKIGTEVSNITKYVKQGQVSAPQISTRQATTSAHLRSGQSFVIGGLMSVQDLDNLSGIPGLMDLPILGELFKYHTHSKSYAEVYIMITPYIVTNDIDPKELLHHFEGGGRNGRK